MYTVMYTVQITLVQLKYYQSILNTDGEKNSSDFLVTTLQVCVNSLYYIEHLTVNFSITVQLTLYNVHYTVQYTVM